MHTTMTPSKTELLIAGQDVPATIYAEIRDPGRLDDVVALLAQASTAQVDEAVQGAHAAFATWRRTPLAERMRLLREAATQMEQMADEVVPWMARESGMLLSINRGEITMAANIVRDNAELAEAFLQPRQVQDATSWVSVEKRPYGVVAAIVSWNAPVILTMRKLAPALVCGNTIVVKPSPSAPVGISMLLRKMAALFPPGVINVVHGGAAAGHALTTHPLVRKVSFTGGGKVATAIMKDAAESIKDVQFELGGNDPALVLEDVDIADAVPKIVGGAFRRTGQFCFAVKRVYVPESLYGAFFEAMRLEVDKFRVGHPLTAGVSMGPMNNRAQYDYVRGLTERTRQAGAQVISLGQKVEGDAALDGYYLMPALVQHAAPDLEVVTSEQFGPILPVVPYRDVAQALAWANEGELGLGSSVWSTNANRAVEIAREIEAGMTFINQAGTSRLGQKNIPFGGVKQSGIGRESSEIGLAEYVEYHGINLHR
jgi:acyl-CoA reductase-like NAD-dependent aldehyde dehydrogenase